MLRFFPLFSYSVRDNLVVENADEIIEELKLYRRAGGGTLCDVTSIGIRIKSGELPRISRLDNYYILYHRTSF